MGQQMPLCASPKRSKICIRWEIKFHRHTNLWRSTDSFCDVKLGNRNRMSIIPHNFCLNLLKQKVDLYIRVPPSFLPKHPFPRGRTPPFSQQDGCKCISFRPHSKIKIISSTTLSLTASFLAAHRPGSLLIAQAILTEPRTSQFSYVSRCSRWQVVQQRRLAR
jgi:hypothetical protein